jgi:hypothetical protein
MGQAYRDLDAAVGVHSGLACGAAHDIPSGLERHAPRCGWPSSVPSRANPRRDSAHHPDIVCHADNDETVYPRNGDQILVQLASDVALGTEVRPSRCRVDTLIVAPSNQFRGEPLLEHWLVHGGDHV